MTLDDTLKKLEAHTEDLRRFKVKSLYVFGSVARGEAGDHSDVDLLVEFSETVGLFAFARLQRFLQEILGVRVDLTTRGALRESMREDVLREAVRAA
jgi:predicted nucleotidyltransferase